MRMSFYARFSVLRRQCKSCFLLNSGINFGSMFDINPCVLTYILPPGRASTINEPRQAHPAGSGFSYLFASKRSNVAPEDGGVHLTQRGLPNCSRTCPLVLFTSS